MFADISPRNLSGVLSEVAHKASAELHSWSCTGIFCHRFFPEIPVILPGVPTGIASVSSSGMWRNTWRIQSSMSRLILHEYSWGIPRGNKKMFLKVLIEFSKKLLKEYGGTFEEISGKGSEEIPGENTGSNSRMKNWSGNSFKIGRSSVKSSKVSSLIHSKDPPGILLLISSEIFPDFYQGILLKVSPGAYAQYSLRTLLEVPPSRKLSRKFLFISCSENSFRRSFRNSSKNYCGNSWEDPRIQGNYFKNSSEKSSKNFSRKSPKNAG